MRTRFIHDSLARSIDRPSGRIAVARQASAHDRPRDDREVRGAMQRMLFPPMPTGDEQSIVVPVLRVAPGEPAERDPRRPARREASWLHDRPARSRGARQRSRCPRSCGAISTTTRAQTDFVDRGRVARRPVACHLRIGAGRGGDRGRRQPDVAVPLLGPRMGPVPVHGARRRAARRGPRAAAHRRPARPGASKATSSSTSSKRSRDDGAAVGAADASSAATATGGWSRSTAPGSLEAAVGAARTRNFALSSGILALLAAAIGLIVVSARRADRLARQQLEFVAAVSHELRTPVSVIGAAAGNLADGVVDEPGRVKKYGATIQTEARRLAETVERVLQLAGIAAGRAAAARTAVAGASRSSTTRSRRARHESDAAGATIEVDIADELRNAPPIRTASSASSAMRRRCDRRFRI